MVAGDGGKRLRQTIAHNHVNADGMDEFLHMGTDRGTCRGEEMRILQTQFLTNEGEDGTVQHLILQMECHRRFLTEAQIFDVMLASNGKGMLEEFTLHGAGMVYLVHHPHVHLLPETGDTGHTGGMRLTHRLLHLLRMGVHDQCRTFRQGEDRPSSLKDMRIGEEVHHTVVLIHRHTLVVCLESGMEH